MRLTRRHLLQLLALASPSLTALGCTRQARIPDGELLDPGMSLGHRLRDLTRDPAFLARAQSQQPAADAPVLDVVIAGAGVAGLSAAWRLRQRGIDRVELIELADTEGGTARSGASPVSAYPWGAHYVTTPLSDDELMIKLLDEVGALEGVDGAGHPIAAEAFACREPEERIWADGRFHDGLTPRATLSDADKRDFARFDALIERYSALVDGAGRRAFTLPRARCSTDAELLALDRLSFGAWLREQGLHSRKLRWLCDYAARDDDGVGVDQCSAWAGLFYFCARRRPGVAERAVITQPDGNGFLVKHLARSSEGKRACDEAVVDVRAAPVPGAPALVDVVTLDHAGALRVRRARHAIVAVPRFIATRIVRELRQQPPAQSAQFSTSAWVVANVHLEERPRARESAGEGDSSVPFAWDTVFADSDSLGFVEATHQTGRDHGPTVWTWYQPLLDDDPARARARLYAGDRAHWADACLRDLERAFPDVRARATRVDVCRWGHAMVRPVPGLFSSGALDAAAAPVGPRAGAGNIHFAHTDLSGMALFEEALFHGCRAADAVAAALTRT